YRTVDGLKVPHKIELHRGPQVYHVVVSRVNVNEPIGERTFDFPKKSQVQLPDLKRLFEEIDANQKQIDKIRENYAGTQVEEETEYDKSGKVTKKEVNEYTFFYLNGDEITTLVKKDGKPLSDEEEKKENEKTQKRIEQEQKREKKKEEKEEKAKEGGKDSNDKEDPGIEPFLRVCQFVNPRRERFRGQDVLVFDFEPNPEYKPKNLEERVVKELAGVVWIDEKALDVVRLEAYFVGDFRLAGGVVANLQKGTSFVFEQAFINNEVWLPTYIEAHVGVRFLLVKGMKVNLTTRYSDYKRFNVETLNTIGKPKDPAEARKPEGRSLPIVAGGVLQRGCATQSVADCLGKKARRKGLWQNRHPFCRHPAAGDYVLCVARHVQHADSRPPRSDARRQFPPACTRHHHVCQQQVDFMREFGSDVFGMRR